MVLEELHELLNDEFLLNGVEVCGIDASGLVLKDRSGTALQLADMSDGYRAAIALLVDILRHMVSVYGPDGLTKRQNGRLVVAKSGVVLIDEIDSHLHPEWQRRIGFWLKERFPKVQFLVTTHSPLICQAADFQGIFHLPPPGNDVQPYQLSDDEYRQVINSKPDTILLSRAFNLRHTRSPRTVNDEQEYSRLAAKRDAGLATDDELKRMRKLREELYPLLSQGNQ